MNIQFLIRTIVWSDYDLSSPILLQDENGPCPLIALVNTLLLKTEVEISHNQFNAIVNSQLQDYVLEFKRYLIPKPKISLADLLSRLGDLLIKFNQDKNYNIDKLLSSLPMLHTGLTINPNITDGNFENDLATELFSCFNLKIHHGWIYKPGSGDTYTENLVSSLKYFDSILDYLTTNDNEKLKKWLDENSTQLTDYGLTKLNDILQSDEFIVFFRNNHFNTLYKKNDHDLYLLITDSSFNKNTKIIWQSLNSTTGKDDLFFNGEFLPVLEELSINEDAEDLRIVKELQAKEDEEMAKSLQKSFNKPPVLQEQPIDSIPRKGATKSKEQTRQTRQTRQTKPTKEKEKEKKSKDLCVIV